MGIDLFLPYSFIHDLARIRIPPSRRSSVFGYPTVLYASCVAPLVCALRLPGPVDPPAGLLKRAGLYLPVAPQEILEFVAEGVRRAGAIGAAPDLAAAAGIGPIVPRADAPPCKSTFSYSANAGNAREKQRRTHRSERQHSHREHNSTRPRWSTGSCWKRPIRPALDRRLGSALRRSCAGHSH